MENIDKLIEAIKRDTWKPIGYFIGVLIAILVSISFKSLVNFSNAALISFVILMSLWSLIWLYKNKLPKTNKNKIGILICIHCKDRSVDERVREDFISSLQESLLLNDSHNLTDVVVLPYHIAEKYKSFEDAKDLLFKCNAIYLLFGVVRKRENRHILDLTARVLHQQLTEESTERFQKDISSAWVKRFKLENADEKFELFEDASQLVSLCSQYIMGLAALASKDYAASEIIMVGVKKQISTSKYKELITVNNIRKNIVHKLHGIYFHQVEQYLSVWEKTRDLSNIVVANDILSKVYGVYKRDGEYLTYKAIIEVLLNRDYVSAITYLKRIKAKYHDALWNINMGFLMACNNKEIEAVDYYNKAIELNSKAAKPLTLEKITQFESFICWFINDNKANVIMHYLLGLMNENIKGDYLQAIVDYSEFIRLANKAELQPFITMAQDNIEKLNHQVAKDE